VIATLRDASTRRNAELSVERERAFLAAMNDVSRSLLDNGNVEMRAQMIDPTSQAVIAENKRVVTLQRDPADAASWIPDLRSFQNVPNVTMCPSTSATDRFGVPLTLALTVTELSSSRVGMATLSTVPSCRQSDAKQLALCQCECGANWTPTRCAGP